MLVRTSQSSGGRDRGATNTSGSDGRQPRRVVPGGLVRIVVQGGEDGDLDRIPGRPTGALRERGLRAGQRTPDGVLEDAITPGGVATSPGVARSSVMAAKTNARETGHNHGVPIRPGT